MCRMWSSVDTGDTGISPGRVKMVLTLRCPLCKSPDVRVVVTIRTTATSAPQGSPGLRCTRCGHRWDPEAHRDGRPSPGSVLSGIREPQAGEWV